MLYKSCIRLEDKMSGHLFCIQLILCNYMWLSLKVEFDCVKMRTIAWLHLKHGLQVHKLHLKKMFPTLLM